MVVNIEIPSVIEGMKYWKIECADAKEKLHSICDNGTNFVVVNGDIKSIDKITDNDNIIVVPDITNNVPKDKIIRFSIPELSLRNRIMSTAITEVFWAEAIGEDKYDAYRVEACYINIPSNQYEGYPKQYRFHNKNGIIELFTPATTGIIFKKEGYISQWFGFINSKPFKSFAGKAIVYYNLLKNSDGVDQISKSLHSRKLIRISDYITSDIYA